METSTHSNEQVSISAAPPPRPRPRLYPVALLPLVPLIIIEVVCYLPLERYRDGGQPRPLSAVIEGSIGRCVGLLVGAFFVAGVVFVLGNRRVRAANVALAVTLLVGCGLLWAAASATSYGRAALINARAATTIATQVQRAAFAQREFEEAGGFSVADFHRAGEVEARLALVEQTRATIAAAIAAGDAAHAAVPRELARGGVFARTRTRSLATFERDFDWPRTSAMYRATLPMYDARIALLRHLAATQGTWSVTPGVNNIEFQTPDAKQHGDEFRDALGRAARDAIAAQRAIAATAPAPAAAQSRPAAPRD